VTRDSILAIARSWKTDPKYKNNESLRNVTVVERFLTMKEVAEAADEKRVSA
jgi:hypothetical protein